MLGWEKWKAGHGGQSLAGKTKLCPGSRSCEHRREGIGFSDSKGHPEVKVQRGWRCNQFPQGGQSPVPVPVHECAVSADNSAQSAGVSAQLAQCGVAVRVLDYLPSCVRNSFARHG